MNYFRKINKSPRLVTSLVLVLLFHFLAPSLAIAKSSPNSDNIFGNKILICTSEGIKYISKDELPSDKQILVKKHCPLCRIEADSNDADEYYFTIVHNVNYPDYEHFYVSKIESKVNYELTHNSKTKRAPPHLFGS